jgi:hypothetical protein
MSASIGTALGMVENEHSQWREPLRQRSEAALRRRAEVAAARREVARRRAHGLVARRAVRLARGRPAGLFEPDLDCTE